METKEKLMSLKNGESYIIPESDYGKAEIWYIHNYYIIFEIPMYGGNPVFSEVITGCLKREQQVNRILDKINKWT